MARRCPSIGNKIFKRANTVVRGLSRFESGQDSQTRIGNDTVGRR
jgi:hypothetical protein